MHAGNSHGSFALLLSLWHHLFPGNPAAAGELYQASVMSALVNGVYEGDLTYGELREHGDFGLGTFNGLDGEMVGFDGVFYQLRSDGSVRVVQDEQKTPFAMVTFFRPERQFPLPDGLAKKELLASMEQLTDANSFTAIRIDGLFEQMQTRTIERQSKPYPQFTEAAAHEAIKTSVRVQGTLAGFRSPAYVQGVSVAGFHLHFLRADKQAGGHALDYRIHDGIAQVQTLHGFHVELPKSDQFIGGTLEQQSLDDKIKATEG